MFNVLNVCRYRVNRADSLIAHLQPSYLEVDSMATVKKTLWAVVQTGGFTPDGQVISYSGMDGTRFPAVLFMHESCDVVTRRKNRIARLSSRVKHLGPVGQFDMKASTPILGVVKVEVEQSVRDKKQEKKPDSVQSSANADAKPAATAPTDARNSTHSVKKREAA